MSDFQGVLRETANSIFSQYEVGINNIEYAEISGGLDMALRSLAYIAVHRIINFIEKNYEAFKVSTNIRQLYNLYTMRYRVTKRKVSVLVNYGNGLSVERSL
ncbi:MAG: hypothetical protein REH83_00235 [Rickettsiella sp.]|nr:hypothetical protein [Rickettsiella sp.]